MSAGQVDYFSIVDSIVDPFANSIDHSIRLLVRSRLFNSIVNSIVNPIVGQIESVNLKCNDASNEGFATLTHLEKMDVEEI